MCGPDRPQSKAENRAAPGSARHRPRQEPPWQGGHHLRRGEQRYRQCGVVHGSPQSALSYVAVRAAGLVRAGTGYRLGYPRSLLSHRTMGRSGSVA